MPRSTAEQRHLGRKINKSELKKGDLVFFRKNNHVGVYIGNNQFMHASTGQGVTISSLMKNIGLEPTLNRVVLCNEEENRTLSSVFLISLLINDLTPKS